MMAAESGSLDDIQNSVRKNVACQYRAGVIRDACGRRELHADAQRAINGMLAARDIGVAGVIPNDQDEYALLYDDRPNSCVQGLVSFIERVKSGRIGSDLSSVTMAEKTLGRVANAFKESPWAN